MRQDQFEVRLTVDSVDYGVWDAREGGGTEGDESKYRPGGMDPPIALGGPPMTGNVTLRKLFRGPFAAATYATLAGLAGSGLAEITFQPLDKAGAAFEKPLVWDGVLIRTEPPEHDSNSSDAATIEVEVSVASPPVTG